MQYSSKIRPHSQWRLAWVVAIFILLGVTANLPAAPAQKTIAIISQTGNEAPPEPIPTLLLDAAQNDPTLRTVERDRLRDVLGELRRGASGATDSATAMKLGRLAAADAVVFLKGFSTDSQFAPSPGRIGTARADAVRARVVDSRTGIILDTFLIEPNGGKDLSPAIKKVSAAVHRLDGAAGPQRYVAIMAVRDEEIGRGVDWIGGPFRLLLEERLSQNSGIFVLNREDVDRLMDEKNLTDLPVELKSSTSLLECAFKRTEDRRGLSITVRFRTPGAANGQEKTITAPLNDVTAAGEQAATAALELLSLPTAPTLSISRQAEADEFTARAHLQAGDVNGFEKGRLMELASILDPTPLRKQLAIETWLGVSQRTTIPLSGDHFVAAIRAEHLRAEALDELARHIDDPVSPHAFPIVNATPASYQNPLRNLKYAASYNRGFYDANLLARDEKHEFKPVRKELVGAALENFDRLMKISRDHDWPVTELLSEKMACLNLLYDSPDEVAAAVRDAAAQVHAEAKAGRISPYNRAMFYFHLRGAFVGGGLKAAEGFVDDSDPLLRQQALNMLSHSGPWGTWDARLVRRALDSAFNDLPLDEEWKATIIAFESNVDQQFGNMLSAFNPEPLKGLDYLEEVIHKAEIDHAGLRLVAHQSLIGTFLARASSEQRVSFAQRITQVIDQSTFSAEDAKQAERLKATLKNSGQPPAKLASAFEGYATTKVPIRDERRHSDLFWFDVEGDEIVVFCAGPTPKGPEASPVERRLSEPQLQMARFSTHGGEVRYMGAQPRPNKVINVNCSCSEAGHYYYATAQAGVIEFFEGKFSFIGEEDGLPSNSVESIAAIDGRLYLGFQEGLTVFDTATRKARTLGSSRETTVKGPLNGGASYKVRTILADPARKCLWIGIAERKGPGTSESRSGIWKMDVSTSALTRVPRTEDYDESNFIWDGDKFDLSTKTAPARFDPQKETVTKFPIRDWNMSDMARYKRYCFINDDLIMTGFRGVQTNRRVGFWGGPEVAPMRGKDGFYAVSGAYNGFLVQRLAAEVSGAATQPAANPKQVAP